MCWKASGYYERWGDPCAAQYASGCYPQTVPGGPDAGHPTQILGAGWDAGCSAPPELWGTQGVTELLSMDGASNVVIKCLSLTDHSNCTVNYGPDPAFSCVKTTSATNGNDPGKGDWASLGMHAQDSDNVTLSDLNIHGFADTGVQAGRISNWTVTNVTVRGNGFAGWNGDLGGNDHTSTNSGTLSFTNLKILWNGCTENYPANTIINCFGPNDGDGSGQNKGYGDGFSEAWTGGDWIFRNSEFTGNSEDGLDLLYANGTGSITIDHVTAFYNAGNSLKVAGNTTISNTVTNDFCSYWYGSSMPIAGGSTSHNSGSMCRAGGGVFADFTAPNQTITLEYSTLTGEPGCMFGGDGFYTPAGNNDPVVASDKYVIRNNIFIGQIDNHPSAGGAYACFTYFGDPPNNKATVQYATNLVWHTRDAVCDATNIICIDPKLTNETMSAFNPIPLPGSPAIGAASGAPPPQLQ